ncbi:tripartite tricarboxylate transporter TctB family protein [Halopiger goleimassiliensis]|uniref:tripartite tricarboxylate transporter TctB family protein n=1 Tax=Halopiger goleimassiliensis TaxID=1293048 RepID=UPI00067789EB|nr:tripartite tricarboxylate transporter TctB family protein [Halopiger goleimassiliensis]
MGFQSAYREVVSRINLEYVLLLLMVGSSTYMIWESYNFSISAAATFPRLTGGFVLIGSLLLLFRSYLPEPLYSFVAESADLLDVEDEELSDVEDEDAREASDEATDISTVGRPIHDSVFTGASALGYGILSYAIGIMWASPIFVLVYGLWFKLSWKSLLVLIPLSLLICFGFYEALNLRVDRGNFIFTEGVLQ